MMEQLDLFSITSTPKYTEIFRGEEVPKSYAKIVREAEHIQKLERNSKFIEAMTHLATKFDQELIQIYNKEQYINVREPLE